MKNLKILIIPIVLLFSCESKNEKKYVSPNIQKAIENPEFAENSKDLTPPKEIYKAKDTKKVEEIEEEPVDFRPEGLKPLQITKEDVMGIWKADYDDGPNATLAIYEDSVLNVEHFGKYKYELQTDTLIIDFGDWKSISIVIKAVKDTLVIIDNNGETVFTTFKD